MTEFSGDQNRAPGREGGDGASIDWVITDMYAYAAFQARMRGWDDDCEWRHTKRDD